MEYYQSLVESKLECVGHSGNNFIYRCPICGTPTSSGHLYVDYQKGMFHCFKCNFAGRTLLQLLVAIGYSPAAIREYPTFMTTPSQGTSSLLKTVRDLVATPPISEIQDYSRDLRTLTEYYDNHSIELSSRALDYLLERGITVDMIRHYQFREGIDRSRDTLTIRGVDYAGKDYSGRILIPSISRDSKISYYVARDYLKRANVQRYLNPPQTLAYSSEDVWNLSNVQSNSVLICEGVFTAIAAGGSKYNAVATYGKSLSHKSNSERVHAKSQGDKLLGRHFQHYIVIYDADALQEMMQTCDYLYRRGASVYYVRVPPLYGEHTDLSDLSETERSRTLSDLKKYTPDSLLKEGYL